MRFLGVSTHTPNLEEVANAAIDSGRFDVMMLAYHFGMWPNFGHILEKAKQHDVGVVAMKTLKGAKHADLAAFRDDAARLLAGGLPLGAVESRTSRASSSRSRRRSTWTSTWPRRAPRCGRTTSRVLERYDQLVARRLLPAALRALSRLLSRATCRSTTCCATACTPATTAGSARACGSTRALDRNAVAVRRLPGAVRRAPARTTSRSARRCWTRTTG